MAQMDVQRVKTILDEALRRPAADRAGYIEDACAGDEALLVEVKSLLAANLEAEGFLDAPSLHGDGVTMGTPVAEAPGDVIGRYKLLEQIGEGGFGVVFMAEQERPVRRRVALKILKPGMDTRQVLARFEAERQALALMDHPHIAKVLDAGATDSGRPYFVMELVRGDPIAAYCDRENLTTPERLDLFRQVCAAVQHAHTKGVIHRDIKPSNVLVATADAKPFPKVIDFGVAKATNQRLTERTLFTEFRQLVGTPEYMSPEQADTTSLVDVDTRSDVYSLGVLLYELLTGVTPFSAQQLREAGFAEMLRIIRETDPPRPSTRLSTMGEGLADVARHRREQPRRLGTLVRGDLDWIVMKALEKERGRRYETANAMSKDIERFLNDEAVEASPPTPMYKARKFVRRHRGGVLAACVVLGVLVLGVIGTTSGLVWALEERGIADAARDDAIENEGQARAAAFEALTISAGQAKREGQLGEAARLLDRVDPASRNHWWRVARAMATSGYEVLSRGQARWSWNADRSLVLGTKTPGEVQVRDGQTLGLISSMPTMYEGRQIGRIKWTSRPDVIALMGGGVQLFSAPDLEPIGPLVDTGGGDPALIGDAYVVRLEEDGIDAVARTFDLRTGGVVAGRRFPGFARFASSGKSGRRWVGFTKGGGNVLVLAVPDLTPSVVIDDRTARVERSWTEGEDLVARYVGRRVECWWMNDDGVPAFAWSRDIPERILGAVADGRHVIVPAGQRVYVFDGRTGEPLSDPIDVGGSCSSATIDAERGRIIAELTKNESRLYELADWRQPYSVRVAETSCRAMEVAPDGRLAAVGTWDAFFLGASGALRLVDPASGMELARLLGPGRHPAAVAMSDDLLCASSQVGTKPDTRKVQVWSLRSGRLLWERPLATTSSQPRFVGDHLHVDHRVFMSRDGRPVSGADRDAATLWSPDGAYALDFTGGLDNPSVGVHDGGSGGLVSTLEATGDFRPLPSAGVSPDSRRVVLPELTVGPGIFDLATGQRVGSLPGFLTDVLATAWSPDGTVIATGGEDAVVRLWDAETLRLVGVLAGHDGYVRAIRFTPDGASLCTISGDGTFRVWNDRTPRQRAQDVARRRAIADELRPMVDRIAAASTDEDAADAWAALEAAQLDAEPADVAEFLLIGALLTRHGASGG